MQKPAKPKRGRPKSENGPGEGVNVRFQAPELAAIDEWRRGQLDMTRPKAIRSLVAQAIAASDISRRRRR
ncbi:MAG: hypothetical protein ACREHV_17480 [Rhizomicrobium sp.]